MNKSKGKMPGNQSSSKSGANFSVAQNDKKASENMASMTLKK